MKNLKITAFLFTIMIFFSGCYSDSFMFTPDDIEEPPIVLKGDIDEFFSAVQPPLDSITFLAEDGLLFITSNNTVLEVYGSSFLNSDGEIVEGPVNFRYIELLNPAEYAFYNLPTISGGQRLRTAGVFRFEAYQDGDKLSLKAGKGITVRLPDDSPEEDMQLFQAEGSGTSFDWINLEEVNTGVQPRIELAEWFLELDTGAQDFIQGYGYLFICDLWQWINVDIFADIPEDERTEVCVELPEEYSNQNTVVFMFFNGENSILSLFPDAEKMKWCEPYGATPLGYTVTMIVISNQGEGIFHMGLQEVVVTEEATIFIEPEEKTLEEIAKAINELE